MVAGDGRTVLLQHGVVPANGNPADGGGCRRRQPHRRAGRDAPADIRANHVGAANAADGLSRGEHRIDISTYKRFNAHGAAVPAGLPVAVRRAAAADAAENARATAEIGTDFGQNRVRGI